MLDNTTLLLALGLLFGIALGALTVLVLRRDSATDTGDGNVTRYSDAELTALVLGIRPDGTRYGEPDRAQHDGVTIDGTCSRYNVARPFDIVAVTMAQEWRSRNRSASRPDFFDDDDGDWLFPEQPNERRFRVDWGV